MAYFRREVGAELALEPFVAKRRHSAYCDVDFDYINEEDSTWSDAEGEYERHLRIQVKFLTATRNSPALL